MKKVELNALRVILFTLHLLKHGCNGDKAENFRLEDERKGDVNDTI